MKNSNTKAHYVTDGKLHWLEGHCDLFRTIAVLNTVSDSNINIKEIIGNYECFSLARSFFDASGLSNHSGCAEWDLVHAVCNYLSANRSVARYTRCRSDIVVIDIVVIDIAVIDVVVIDAMSAIFRLPKSTKFKSFQMLSSSFMASYSYCEKSLTALTRERRKGHHLSVQYDVI